MKVVSSGATMSEIKFIKDTRRSDPMKGYTARGGRAATYLLNPGGFEVYVDGKHWGRVTTEGKGSNGLQYHLCQIGSDGVARGCCKEVPSDVNPRLRAGRTTRLVYYTAWSDKVYLRNIPKNMSPVPVAERLMNLVTAALQDGALRDPAVIAAEAKAAGDKRRSEEAARLQAQDEAWKVKALEALGPAQFAFHGAAKVDLVARIVAAMKWAQSQ